MKKSVLLFVILYTLVGCGSNDPVIVSYQMPTKEQLYAAGYQDGDLPVGFFDGKYKYSRPFFYDEKGVPASAMELAIDTGNPPLSGLIKGRVILSWYPTSDHVDQAYDALSGPSYSEKNPVEGIGDKAVYFTNGFVGIGGFMFKRCGLVIYIEMTIQPYSPKGFNQTQMFEYATTIDERIMQQICPVTESQ